MIQVKTLAGTYSVGGGVTNPTSGKKLRGQARVYALPSTARGKRRAANRKAGK